MPLWLREAKHNWPGVCFVSQLERLNPVKLGECNYSRGRFMSTDSHPKITNLDELIKRGEQHFAQGQVEDAHRCFAAALELNPGHSEALNNLAVLCHHSGDLDQAEIFFLRAAALANDPSDALLNLSAVAWQAARIPESTGYLERCLRLEGETPRVLEQMSFLCDSMGDPHAAAALYKKARKISTSTKTDWYASFCEIDITPELDDKIELQGYFGPSRVPEEILSELKAQVLLFEDAFGKRALFVTADIFGFGQEMVSVIRKFAAIWGIDPSAVILNASHTHYGPGTVSHTVAGLGRFDHDFANDVCQAIGQCLPLLYQNLQPAQLTHTVAHAQIGFNRRRSIDGLVKMIPNPDAHYETTTPVMSVKLDNGQRLLMVNHGCHPTGLGALTAISADYPGEMRDALMGADHADVVMFFQGAAGDIKQGVQVDNQVGWIGDYQSVQILGRQLATAVAGSLSDLKAVEGPLRAMRRDVVAPLKDSPADLSVLERPENARVSREMIQNWAAVVKLLHPDAVDSLSIELGCVSIGDVLFVSMPGEPMAITAARLREISTRHESVFALGYTNGLAAYFPADEMIEEGGYEAHSSSFVYSMPAPFDVGVEHQLLEASYIAGIGVAPPVETSPAYPRPDSVPGSFFVMSTGRSGTQTLAAMLKMAENANVWHHPQPYMIQETLHAYRGEIDPGPTFWAGRGQIIRSAWDQGLIHGETDHNMTPFCGEIARAVPGAKFVVLVRDPREFVRSGMRRNYYRGVGEWEEGRLRPRSDDPTFESWSKRDQFEKVCWLWRETYEHIERMCREIGDDRVYVLRFEDLIASPDATRDLFNFIGLDGYDETQARAILGKKMNAQQVGDFPHPSKWTDELHNLCWDEVGELASVYGYPEQYPKRRAVGAA